MAFATVFVLLIGIVIRQWLFCSTYLAQWLAERNELNTPLTSWKRMTEGLALVRAGVSPYSGDVFHETPLMLTFIGFMDDLLGSKRMWIVFLTADMLTVMVLSAVADEMSSYFLKRQETEKTR
jgi:GPI-anchor transamidase subunit U